ncbi:MAG: NAD(P)H-dependent oxidoreductase [Thermoproteota archaeon]|jgi:NAD(P)H-dependent FMN reductase|nr:NAD(P)H-dependent oxidoreductase [Thermoproteota archaeon]
MTDNIKSLVQSSGSLENGDQKDVHHSSKINVLGVAGSLRQESYSTLGLKIVLEEAKKYGSKSDLLDLRELNLPLYDPARIPSSESASDNTRRNSLERTETALKWADALILASPDYHGSMSGTVKNFLDYFWEEFAGKTFGYIVASHEKGLTVADQMRTAIRQCYGWSMPYNISINGEKDFDSRGILVNSALAKRLKMLARDLVIYGTLIRKQFLSDVADYKISDSFASHYRGYYN